MSKTDLCLSHSGLSVVEFAVTVFRTTSLPRARGPPEPGQEVADVRLVHGAASERAEERTAVRAMQLPACVEPPGDDRGGPGVDADGAALAALPALDDERPGVGVEVLRRERERLADAEPAPPQDGHQGAVAHTRRRSSRTLPHEEFDFVSTIHVSPLDHPFESA
jgi:hypothetical protein